MRVQLLCVFLVTALSPVAHAVVYQGNPIVTLEATGLSGQLTRGDGHLDRLRLHACGGGTQDFVVDEKVDPVAGVGIAVASGDWCGATAFWASTLYLEGENQDGTYVLAYDEASTYVALQGQTQSVDLDPFEVIAGIIHTGNPNLRLTIQ